MTLLFVLAGFAVVCAVGLLAVGRLGELAPVEPDRAPLDLPERPLDRADVDAVRFAVGFRGYRMDEVDDILDRLGVDLAERDARIAALEAAAGDVRPTPAGTSVAGAPGDSAGTSGAGGSPADATGLVAPSAPAAADDPVRGTGSGTAPAWAALAGERAEATDSVAAGPLEPMPPARPAPPPPPAPWLVVDGEPTTGGIPPRAGD